MAKKCIRFGRGKGGRRVCREYSGTSRRRRGLGQIRGPKTTVAKRCARFKTVKGKKRCVAWKQVRIGAEAARRWYEKYE